MFKGSLKNFIWEYGMKNSIKAWVISVAMATMPLNVDANSFDNSKNDLKNQTNTELSTVLSSPNKEKVRFYIEPSVVTKAMLDYFDEEVKMYKLSSKARAQITPILNDYFGNHCIFNVQWDKLEFVIDDKKEFSLMVKKLVNVVINDMPFLVRKLVIPLFLWWNDAIQAKLDNLDGTLMNMKEKQYKEVMLDYVAWITKRVANSVNWRITVGEYYEDISSYYPNKNWKHILEELKNSGDMNLDIRKFKYKK